MNATLAQASAWLYSDHSAIVRVVERGTDDGQVEVIADGPDALRGRRLFATRAEAAQFRRLLERQLTAAGFAGVAGAQMGAANGHQPGTVSAANRWDGQRPPTIGPSSPHA